MSDSLEKAKGSPLIRPTAAFTKLGFHWPGRSILGFRLTHICSQNLLWRMRVWVTDFSRGEGWGGAGHKKDRALGEVPAKLFVSYTLCGEGRVKARDRSGDIDGEKESRSDLGKQSGFCGE